MIGMDQFGCAAAAEGAADDAVDAAGAAVDAAGAAVDAAGAVVAPEELHAPTRTAIAATLSNCL